MNQWKPERRNIRKTLTVNDNKFLSIISYYLNASAGLLSVNFPLRWLLNSNFRNICPAASRLSQLQNFAKLEIFVFILIASHFLEKFTVILQHNFRKAKIDTNNLGRVQNEQKTILTKIFWWKQKPKIKMFGKF